METQEREVLLSSTVASLRLAIALDPSNDEAKHNLELAFQRGRGYQLTEGSGGANPTPGGSWSQGCRHGRSGLGILMASALVFLTPVGAVLAIGVLLPLTALYFIHRRAQRVRGSLELSRPSARHLFVAVGAVIAAGAFLGVAAAQPVLQRTSTLRTRTDAEVFVVVDISRSMLARHDAGSPARIARAKVFASLLRASIPEVPVGIASLTDRTLPHLFPGVDKDVFNATLDRSVGIERPPPRSSLVTTATKLDALATIRGQRYFTPKSRKRARRRPHRRREPAHLCSTSLGRLSPGTGHRDGLRAVLGS